VKRAVKTLLGVLALPEVLGAHTCEECGHPQMRRLPDGVFHCPACCAEVTPVVR
jgi:ribosomal protein L37AE/L43A